jgi:hypothetical protein
MSNFDPSLFLDASTTEASVKRPLIPAGLDITGTIGDIKASTWQGKKDPTQSGIKFDIPITFDLTAMPDLHKSIGADSVTLTDTIMLDVTENGSIDYGPGKNGKLRRYREALGMNVPGEAFSPRAMTGRLIKAKIKHDLYEGDVYDKIDSIAKA